MDRQQRLLAFEHEFNKDGNATAAFRRAFKEDCDRLSDSAVKMQASRLAKKLTEKSVTSPTENVTSDMENVTSDTENVTSDMESVTSDMESVTSCVLRTDVNLPPDDAYITWGMLEWALYLAGFGLKIHPLQHGGKRPILKHWNGLATDCADSVAQWWAESVPGFPKTFNVGVTGALFLDIDNKNDVKGSESLAKLIEKYGQLPDTFTVSTPTGGLHYYFQPDPSVKNAAGSLKDYPGIDVRSINGYVVGPGSSVAAGTYEIISETATIAKCPGWLVDLLRSSGADSDKNRSERVGNLVAHGVEIDSVYAFDRAINFLKSCQPPAVGQRNNTAFRIAGTIKDFGLSEDSCLDLMLSEWDMGGQDEWADAEIPGIVKHIYHYGIHEVGSDNPFVFDAVEETQEENDGIEPAFIPKSCDDLGWIVDEDPPDMQFVVDSILPLGRVGLLLGHGGGGKSRLVMELAAAVAAGIPFMGHPTQQGRVLLVAAEDEQTELRRRISKAVRGLPADLRAQAWAGIYPESRAKGLQNKVTQKTSRRGDVTDTTFLPRLIKAAKMIDNLALIVLDPVSRFRGGEENSAEDTTRFVEAIERIAGETGASVLLVHHVNKSAISGSGESQNAARGSSALVDGVRAVWNLLSLSAVECKKFGIPEQERRRYAKLTISKNNYGPLVPDMYLDMKGFAGGVQHVNLKEIVWESVYTDEEFNILTGIKNALYFEDIVGIQHTTSTLCDKYAGNSDLCYGASKDTLTDIIKKAIGNGDILATGEQNKSCQPVLSLPDLKFS